MQNDATEPITPDDKFENGPMNRNRDPTDFKFFIFFIILIGIWAGIGFYAMKVGDKNHSIFIKGHWSKGVDELIDAFQSSKSVLAMYTIIAAGLSVIFIISLRWFAKVIVWIAIFAFCMVTLLKIVNFFVFESKYRRGIYLSVFLVGVICLAVVARRMINATCEVIRESCKAILCLPSLLFVVPVSVFVLSILIFVYFMTVLSCLMTIDNGVSLHVLLFQIYNILGFIWMLNFVQGIGQMIMSGSFATWFWTYNKNNVSQSVVLQSAYNTSRFHLGTVALGAMIIGICQCIDATLKAVKKRLQPGSCCDCLFGPCFYNFYSCYLEGLEALVYYVNSKAYVMTSVHGTDFVTSAKRVFYLIERNITTSWLTHKVTKLTLYFGQIVVIAIPGVTSYLFIYTSDSNDDFTRMWLVIIAALLTSEYFFNVLEVAMDTVFICALEDYERNDVTKDNPHYMSDELKQIMMIDQESV